SPPFRPIVYKITQKRPARMPDLRDKYLDRSSLKSSNRFPYGIPDRRMVRVAWGKERQNCILTYPNIANSLNLKSTPKYLGRYLMQASSDTRANYRPDTSYGLFIDNQWVAGDSGETLDI